ncbi:S41 family peptidase [Croceitalea rosinachiae]|uniref:S41 family peptidase n=1 Tax=Croceitalea rosinachiae TaxID=3075596 RepID=A0ABU3A6A3_9FLAO|nr:S41 family peptidase [Croceitalea sp. F388]MDT0605712.1 S41 family peptidase [Croceitalea sp. F388]
MISKRAPLMFFILLNLTRINFLTAQLEIDEVAPIIERNLLLEDLEILKTNLEIAQPQLYQYTSKKEMDVFFEEFKNGVTDNMNSLEFFRLIAPLSNKIRNGHTILVPSSKWEDFVVNKAGLLPLDLYFYENEMYVLHNLSSQNDIKEGALLKSINGQPTMEIFNYLVHRWFKDGYNQTRPREIVQEEFRLLYAHFFKLVKSYSVKVINPDGAELTIDIKAIQEPEFKRRLKQRYDKEFVPWWRRNAEPNSFELKNGTAYLKVGLFSSGFKSDKGQRFNKFIKNTFETIEQKNIQNLILDLRGNQGGDVKPQLELLRHLVKTPFHLYKDVFAITRSLPNPELYEFDILSRAEFKNDFLNEKVANRYPMKKRPGFSNEPQHPSENLFEGNLYVLIDGWSFSATGEVAGLIKEHRKDAVFVGEETGGNPVTNISGIQTFMTLPNSKNRILICLVNYTTHVSYENDGYGIKPDHEIRNSVFDILNENDMVLKKVSQLISESENK